MRDLDILATSVRDPLSRPHLQEAVRAFQSGAYRAAIVEAWVAVALDLTNKIRHLADTGDGEARVKIEQLDKAIDERDTVAMQQHERTILEVCETSFEFLTSRERVELERLYEDRNLSAHPAFVKPGEVFAPTAELVRGHLAAAVDCALALPPVSGRKALDNFLRDVDSSSWPRDGDLANYLRTEYLSGTRRSVCINLTKLVLKGSMQPPTDEALKMSVEIVASRCRASVHAIYEVQPDLVREGIHGVVSSWERTGSLTDEVLLRMVGALGHLSVLWSTISPGTKSRVVALLEVADPDMLIDNQTFAAGQPADDDVAAAYAHAKTGATAEFVNLERLVETRSVERAQWVGPALDALEGAASFRAAETRLRCLLKLAPQLSSEDLERASVCIRTNSQIYQASDTPELLQNLYRETCATDGTQDVWQNLAEGLHEDYMTDHDDPEGYYSYKSLLDLARGLNA